MSRVLLSRCFAVGSKDMSTWVFGAERWDNLIYYALGGHKDAVVACFFESSSLDVRPRARPQSRRVPGHGRDGGAGPSPGSPRGCRALGGGRGLPVGGHPSPCTGRALAEGAGRRPVLSRPPALGVGCGPGCPAATCACPSVAVHAQPGRSPVCVAVRHPSGGPEAETPPGLEGRPAAEGGGGGRGRGGRGAGDHRPGAGRAGRGGPAGQSEVLPAGQVRPRPLGLSRGAPGGSRASEGPGGTGTRLFLCRSGRLRRAEPRARGSGASSGPRGSAVRAAACVARGSRAGPCDRPGPLLLLPPLCCPVNTGTFSTKKEILTT